MYHKHLKLHRCSVLSIFSECTETVLATQIWKLENVNYLSNLKFHRKQLIRELSGAPKSEAHIDLRLGTSSKK